MADATVLAIPMPSGSDDRAQAEALATRYHAEFVDLKNFKIQHDLLRTVPVELMFRYNFVPIEQNGDALVIAVSDPSRLMILDEISGLLGHRIVPRVATLSQITDLLKKTEQSQRVLDEASEGLTFDVLTGEDNADENISIEKLTSEEDISPIIRLVDTTIFTALERRASDIHIETLDDSVVIVKYRIDGVLQMAMAPIAREHHSTILSRIKIMSELDIAERRVPQDGRFRVRYKGRLIDFRVSIMPTVHGENAVLRVLDKESMSEKFHNLTLDVVGFADADLKRFRRYIREPYGMVLVTEPVRMAHHAVRLANVAAKALQIFVNHHHVRVRLRNFSLIDYFIEHAEDGILAMHRRHDGNAEVNPPALVADAEAPSAALCARQCPTGSC